MNTIVSILLGIAVGAGISAQSTFNSVLTKAIGLWPTVLIVHLSGLTVLMFPLYWFRQHAQWHGWNHVPWYVYLGGLMGAFIIAGIAYLVGRIGVTAGISIILAAQLASALVIDFYGLFGATPQSIDWIKILGVAFMMVGVRLILR